VQQISGCSVQELTVAECNDPQLLNLGCQSGSERGRDFRGMGCAASQALTTGSSARAQVQSEVKLPHDWLIVKSVALDITLHPDEPAVQQIINFGEPKLVHGVGVGTLRFQDLQTEIRGMYVQRDTTCSNGLVAKATNICPGT
jgi:hypothetical protein